MDLEIRSAGNQFFRGNQPLYQTENIASSWMKYTDGRDHSKAVL
jgi:hypothetical protein